MAGRSEIHVVLKGVDLVPVSWLQSFRATPKKTNDVVSIPSQKFDTCLYTLCKSAITYPVHVIGTTVFTDIRFVAIQYEVGVYTYVEMFGCRNSVVMIPCSATRLSTCGTCDPSGEIPKYWYKLEYMLDRDLLSLRHTVTRNYCKVKYHTVIH